MQNLGFNTNRDEQIVIGQILNFLAGLAILVIVWMFIGQLSFQTQRAGIFAFALTALNPKLIGINSQVTNDTFLLLFSTAAIYFAFLYLQKKSGYFLILTIVFSTLAISSKSSGWAAPLAFFLALLVMGWLESEKRFMVLSLAVLQLITVILLVFLNPVSQYFFNFQNYGSPVLASIAEKRPLPHFFTQTHYSDSGVISIQDGFFTFKFADLLKHPRIERGDWTKQPLRTSFWTLLYGRAHSLHFDNWPVSWSTSSDQVFPLTRSIYILATIPTFIILFGAALQIKFMVHGFNQTVSVMKYSQSALMLLVFGGYLGFVVMYSIIDQGYQVIKAIFVFPALLSLVFFFLQGYQKLNLFLEINRRLKFAIDAALIALLFLYAMDVYILIVHLCPQGIIIFS
jgi:hypothetical protein